MKDQHQEKLKRMVAGSITKTFKAALEELELVIATIASSMDDDDVEKLKLRHKKLSEMQELVRKRILRVGNNEIRELCDEIDTNWKVRQRYKVTPVEDHREVYTFPDN